MAIGVRAEPQLSWLRRGFGNPEAQWVPEVLEKLTEAGLLTSHMNARHNKAEPLYSLALDRREMS